MVPSSQHLVQRDSGGSCPEGTHSEEYGHFKGVPCLAPWCRVQIEKFASHPTVSIPPQRLGLMPTVTNYCIWRDPRWWNHIPTHSPVYLTPWNWVFGAWCLLFGGQDPLIGFDIIFQLLCLLRFSINMAKSWQTSCNLSFWLRGCLSFSSQKENIMWNLDSPAIPESLQIVHCWNPLWNGLVHRVPIYQPGNQDAMQCHKGICSHHEIGSSSIEQWEKSGCFGHKPYCFPDFP